MWRGGVLKAAGWSRAAVMCEYVLAVYFLSTPPKDELSRAQCTVNFPLHRKPKDVLSCRHDPFAENARFRPCLVVLTRGDLLLCALAVATNASWKG